MSYTPERKNPALGGAPDMLDGKDHEIINPENNMKLVKVKKTPTAVIVVKITPQGLVCVVPGFIRNTQFGEIGCILPPYLCLDYARHAAKLDGLVHLALTSDGDRRDTYASSRTFDAWEASFGGGA